MLRPLRVVRGFWGVAGLALHWRPVTRDTNQQYYARWLGWLDLDGQLDSNIAPAARVTPDKVHTYGAHLSGTLAMRTVASALIGLKVVVKVMAPDEDWRWLMDLTNRCNTLAKPSVDRSSAMRPVEEINRAACIELDRLLATPLQRRIERVAYCDTLVVLLLSACPIRLRNLAGLQIGEHLRREHGRWTVRIDEEETKNRQRLDYLLPRHFGPWLAVYLDRVRPSFNPAADCDALWLGFEGGPLCAHSVYGRIVLATRRLFGTPINPHLFRSCAATKDSNVWCPRLTTAMICSGPAVQAKGLGFSLVSATNRLMAAWRSTREWKTPRLSRRLASLAKNPSTALSHEQEVGVKWKVKRLWRSSHAQTPDAYGRRSCRE